MKRKTQTAFTFVELIVTVAMVAILAATAMPMVQMTIKRNKETELRSCLREIRSAIDAYKLAYDQGHIRREIDKSGYPPNLDVLVAGVPDEKDPLRHKMRFLRRVPNDPMLNEEDRAQGEAWGLRSYASDPDNPQTGEDVYDVYSLSPHVGINGVPYAAW